MKRFTGFVEVSKTRPPPPVTSPFASASPEERLFAAAAQAVLFIDAATHTVIEGNPAAARRFGRSRTELIGVRFPALFQSSSQPGILAGLHTAEAGGRKRDVGPCLTNGGDVLHLRLSVIRAGSASHVLVHLEEAVAPVTLFRGAAALESSVLDLLDDLADGFLVTDAALRVTYANRAFVTMTGEESAEDVRGAFIPRWFDLVQSDLDALSAQMSQRQSVQILHTAFRKTGLPLRDVALWAVYVPDVDNPSWGFRVCDPAPATAAF